MPIQVPNIFLAQVRMFHQANSKWWRGLCYPPPLKMYYLVTQPFFVTNEAINSFLLSCPILINNHRNQSSSSIILNHPQSSSSPIILINHPGPLSSCRHITSRIPISSQLSKWEFQPFTGHQANSTNWWRGLRAPPPHGIN